jgi:hypothetical protein
MYGAGGDISIVICVSSLIGLTRQGASSILGEKKAQNLITTVVFVANTFQMKSNVSHAGHLVMVAPVSTMESCGYFSPRTVWSFHTRRSQKDSNEDSIFTPRDELQPSFADDLIVVALGGSIPVVKLLLPVARSKMEDDVRRGSVRKILKIESHACLLVLQHRFVYD